MPVLGAAGLLWLAGGGAATQAAPAADIPARHVEPSHEFTLSEEEVSDVSLATFYVFDKERASPPAFTLARACGRCGGCARCAAGRCAVGRCVAAAARSAPAPAVAAAVAPAIVIQRVAATPVERTSFGSRPGSVRIERVAPYRWSPSQQLRQLGDVGGDAPTRIKEAANTAASTD